LPNGTNIGGLLILFISKLYVIKFEVPIFSVGGALCGYKDFLDYSEFSLPEVYFLHFSITCFISSGNGESNESLFPVTG
jgi:hypothetical protein